MSLTILVIVLPTIFAIVYQMVWVPAQGSATLQAQAEVRQGFTYLEEDARRAQGFIGGSDPSYGAFAWQDYSGGSPITYTSRYFFAATAQELQRVVTGTSVVTTTVARNITAYSDVVFTATVGTVVTVTITSTVDGPRGSVQEASTVVLRLRGESVGTGISTSTPTATPAPPPPLTTPTPTPTPTPTVTPTPTNTPTPVTVTLYPTQDSYTDKFNSGTNYGTLATLYIDSRAASTKRLYVQFDLSSIPSTATVISASLSLYLQTAPGGNRTHEMWRVALPSPSWMETTITWATQPTVEIIASDSRATGTTSGVWITWASLTLLSDVQGFVNGTYTNWGWRGNDSVETTGASQLATYCAREAGTTACTAAAGTTYDPQLVVTYIP